ncbi:hypothetical protein GALL_537760 [mine drainage metagenome]|uniref:Uncharacterized protein n=1 Tax=mine drainage metagenome TaxID=410659 RepID=A0A1J5P0U3_9ZZZZ
MSLERSGYFKNRTASAVLACLYHIVWSEPLLSHECKWCLPKHHLHTELFIK